MSKVMVIGLDGATFDIIHPLVAQNRLPNLAYLLNNGAWGPLLSSIPPITPAAWTSFFTGKNPGKHGIYDFKEIDYSTYKLKTLRTDTHYEKTIWDLLSEANLKSIIMDVPFTYPPKPLNGMMITGYGTPRTPDTIFTYPDDLKSHLPADLHSEIRVAVPQKNFERSKSFIDDWENVMIGRERLIRYLIKERDWNLFMLVFSITDNMAHVFWTYVDPSHPNYYRPEGAEYREAFLKSYETCDKLLGMMMDLAGPETTTLVLSDHGFGSVYPRQYIMQRLLKENYIYPPHSPSFFSFRDKFLRFAINTYTKIPIVREWIKGLSASNLTKIKKTVKQANLVVNVNNMDFKRSKIIPISLGLRMWINDFPRFTQGIVPAEEKEAVLAELSQFLKSDLDLATGLPIISNTYRGQDIYHGPLISQSPDLLVEQNNFYQPHAESHPENPYLEGGHTPYGIFLMHGPNTKNAEVKDASLIDLAPTILHLFQHPIPPDMDGRVLSEAFSETYLNTSPPKQGTEHAQYKQITEGSGYTAEEEAEIEDQLRQLGYI